MALRNHPVSYKPGRSNRFNLRLISSSAPNRSTPADRVGLKRVDNALVPPDLPAALGYRGRSRYLMLIEMDGNIVMSERPDNYLDAADASAWLTWLEHPGMRVGAKEIEWLMPSKELDKGVLVLDLKPRNGMAVFVGEMYRALDLLANNETVGTTQSNSTHSALTRMEHWLDGHYCP